MVWNFLTVSAIWCFSKLPDTQGQIDNSFRHICLLQVSVAGLLMKRSTCLYATKDRLKFVNEVLTKVQIILFSDNFKCKILVD